jgi:hypothetical protein
MGIDMMDKIAQRKLAASQITKKEGNTKEWPG